MPEHCSLTFVYSIQDLDCVQYARLGVWQVNMSVSQMSCIIRSDTCLKGYCTSISIGKLFVLRCGFFFFTFIYI